MGLKIIGCCMCLVFIAGVCRLWWGLGMGGCGCGCGCGCGVLDGLMGWGGGVVEVWGWW